MYWTEVKRLVGKEIDSGRVRPFCTVDGCSQFASTINNLQVQPQAGLREN